jgi:hypothetical protein
MPKDGYTEVIEQIRELYRTDKLAQRVFDWTAARSRDATSTSVDRICSLLGISRGEAVALARRLADAGCGQFLIGRRGQPSRLRWEYSCISLGQAAAGESEDLEAADHPVPDEDEEKSVVPEGTSMSSVEGISKLTINQAKEALAASLGVPITSIEILIRG